MKNSNYDEKYKLWWKIKIVLKNTNYDEKYKLCWKIQIMINKCDSFGRSDFLLL